MRTLSEFYRDRRVLVTGHTGFKGTWLAAWLNHLGADVVGYSLAPPSQPCAFDALHLGDRLHDVRGDVRDRPSLYRAMKEFSPEVVFHLAAQSLVRPSLENPSETFETNVMGTVNVLEAARRSDSVLAIVCVTSDKSYLNKGWPWAYRETDELGGYDPYSASKACAELVVSCFVDARFQQAAPPGRRLAVASARAGNVIGGGDWARDRIVPDLVRSICADGKLVVRNPDATRPWQHVLESAGAYLWLGCQLSRHGDRYSGAWNFGPAEEQSCTVAQLVAGLLARWSENPDRMVVERDTVSAESQRLRLDCGKARQFLHWRATWGFDETLDAVAEWYRAFLADPQGDHYALTLQQIERYAVLARERGLEWAV